MLTATISEARIVTAPIFKISKTVITMECTAVDGGSRYKLYGSHSVIIYYMMRFCVVGSRHVITGPLRASAYTFDDSPKAYVSLRMTVEGIRPIYSVSEEGVVEQTAARRVNVEDYTPNQKFLKLKFMIFMHVWVNSGDENLVRGGSSWEPFIECISDMYDDLDYNRLITRDLNPVMTISAVSRPREDANHRPVPRTLRTVYEINERWLHNFDWTHDALSLAKIIDDSKILDPAVYINVEFMATN